MIEFSQQAKSDDTMELFIAGNLDAVTAPQLRATIEELGDGDCPVVAVDLSGLDLIDSSGVAVLVSLYKRLRTRSAEMHILGIRDQPLAILKLLKLDRVFDLKPGRNG